MSAVAQQPQLDLFSELDAFKVKQAKLMAGLEKQLDNMKFLYTQLKLGNVGASKSERSRGHLREAQLILCHILTTLGIHYNPTGVPKHERNFKWFYDGWVKDGGAYYLQTKMGEIELHEALYYQRNRLVTLLTQYRPIWQLFCEESVKALEIELKRASEALR